MVRHSSHSLPEQPRAGIFSKLETQLGIIATHFLKGKGYVSSLSLTHRDVVRTHSLKSKGQVLSAGLKYSKAW